MKARFLDGEIRLDQQANARDVLWLGAGFSTCATSGHLPVLANFFDQLEEFEYPSLFCFLRQWMGNPRRANVEEALVALEQLGEAPVAEARCKGLLGPDAGARAKQELGAYCIARLSRFCVKPGHWSFRLLHSVDALTTVVTTNYDTVVEFILKKRPGLRHAHEADTTCHSCKTDALLGFDCECGPRPQQQSPSGLGAVLKLHGSVSWRICRNASCDQFECMIPRRDPCQHQCLCCGGRTEPVLVLPSMAKSYKQFPHLKRMWDSALDAIEQAARVIAFGFSFPATDGAINRLFRSAATKAPDLRDVVVIDANPTPIATRLREMLSVAPRIRVMEFPVPLDGSTPTWWKTDLAVCLSPTAVPAGAGSVR